VFDPDRPSARNLAFRLVAGAVGGVDGYKTVVADLRAMQVTPRELSDVVAHLSSLCAVTAALYGEVIGAPVEDIVHVLDIALEPRAEYDDA
jgi:hypothetical protein